MLKHPMSETKPITPAVSDLPTIIVSLHSMLHCAAPCCASCRAVPCCVMLPLLS